VRAVHDALPLLARSSEVTVVSILDDKTLTDQDPRELCKYLALWDVPARAVVVKRDNRSVGMVLLDYAERSTADLLVMGGFAHGFERALVLGSATRDIFQAKLKIPVLLSN
jgi:nucleotide-binding universal stress UspA family protein